MMSNNNFKARMYLLGLRDGTAAEFLGVNPRTIEKMKAGRRIVPVGIDSQLTRAYTNVYDTALKLSERISLMAPGDEEYYNFTLGITTNDADARRLGWPCQATHAIMGAMVAHFSHDPVKLVDRIIPADVEFDLGWPTVQADLEELKLIGNPWDPDYPNPR